MILQSGDEKAPDTIPDTGSSMKIWEKMDLWHTASENDYPSGGKYDEPLQGVDDEDGAISFSLPIYSRIVLNSPAYDWLISSIKRECAQSSIALRDIATRILSGLPTARISKHRLPEKHRASFQLSWQSMTDRARLEFSRDKPLPETAPPEARLLDMAALTSSSDDELQASHTEDYFQQTWPCLGRGLLHVIDLTVRRGPGTSTTGKIP